MTSTAVRGETQDTPHQDRTLILTAIGALLPLFGGVAAVAGPVEMYCFALFS